MKSIVVNALVRACGSGRENGLCLWSAEYFPVTKTQSTQIWLTSREFPGGCTGGTKQKVAAKCHTDYFNSVSSYSYISCRVEI